MSLHNTFIVPYTVARNSIRTYYSFPFKHCFIRFYISVLQSYESATKLYEI